MLWWGQQQDDPEGPQQPLPGAEGCSKAPALFIVGQIMLGGPNGPFAPSPVQQRGQEPALAAGGLFSFIFCCVFRKSSRAKK